MTKSLQKKWKYVLYLLIAIGVAASLVVGAERVGLEQANRSTLLTLEWGQFKDVAARNGSTADEALEYMLGEDPELFSGVVYKEPTLYDWQSNGALQIDTGAQWASDVRSGEWVLVNAEASGNAENAENSENSENSENADNAEEIETVESVESSAYELDYNHNFILCNDEDMQQRVFNHLQYKTSAQNQLLNFAAGDSMLYVVETSYPYTDLIQLGIGFGDDDLALISKYDLGLVVQVRSWPKVDEASLEFVFGDLAQYNILVAGFNDSELPGVSQNDWDEISTKLAEILQRQNVPTAYIEFYAQSGLQTLAKKMDYNLVRVHPVSESELLKLNDTRLQERFALAASERSMGTMMLRLRPTQSLEEAVDYIAAVRDAIQAKGIATNQITTVPSMSLYTWALGAVLAAIWAGGVLLLLRFDLKKTALLLPTIAVVAALGLYVIGKVYILQKLLGLAAVIIFPFLGVASITRSRGRSLPAAILGLCRMTLISLVGAALVVGTLSESSYMSAMNTFSGVKVGQLTTLGLLMIYLLYKLAREHGGANYLLVGFARLMKKQVTVGLVLIAALAAGLLVFYMLRTGNSGVGISDFERTFRAFLDKVLLVRPRTKEFMFAHPIMLAMLYFGYKRKLWPFVLLGAIGQVSLVNTFEHLHTPITVSLLRTFNGLALGIVIGIILIYVVKYIGGWAYAKLHEIARLAEDESYGG